MPVVFSSFLSLLGASEFSNLPWMQNTPRPLNQNPNAWCWTFFTIKLWSQEGQYSVSISAGRVHCCATSELVVGMMYQLSLPTSALIHEMQNQFQQRMEG